MNHHQNPLDDKEVLEFIDFINEHLVDKFGLSSEEAHKYIYRSSFIKLLQKDQDLVFHYSSLYWANHIANENETFLQLIH